VNVSCYLNKEEAEFFSGYPKGWLKELVLKEMRGASASADHPQVDEERAREHFPPGWHYVPSEVDDNGKVQPYQKDVFGPRLKR
jgi:hypothetical protein